MSIDIEHIIKSCLKGNNRKAQKELYEYTYVHLLNSALRYTKDKNEAQWIFNIAMLKVFKSLSSYQKGSNYLGWARTIITRTCIDYIRKNSKHKETLVPIVSEKQTNEKHVINKALDKMEADKIIDLIQGLPERERLIFSMYEIDGYSHVEIQETTGIKKNTSKWLLAKSKKMLKEKLVNIYNIKSFSNE